MLGSGPLISGAGIATGIFAIVVLTAWAVMAYFTVLAVRRGGEDARKGALWGGGLVLGSVLLTSLLFDRVLTRDLSAERRAIEARASELVARAIAPGSSLTCLDAVSTMVENACEKALFATPEAVAAAVAYVEARYSLLVASAALAARDPSYQPAVERLRRGIEDDRFGLVAQVFSMRGCNAPDCPDLAVLRDSRRVLANMKGQTFATHVEAHGITWNVGGGTPAFAAASPMPSSSAVRPPELGIAMPAPTSGGPGRPRYDYPSADTIPPISIMDPELPTPEATQQRRSASRPARERAPAAAPLPAPAGPPTATSGSR
jgi:hypothetical protein